MEHEENVSTSPAIVPQPQEKRYRVNKWQAITVVLVTVIVALGFLYLPLSSSYNTLESEHGWLKDQYSTLQARFGELHNDYDSLGSDYSSLQSNYSSLQNQHNSLQSDYDSLQGTYDSYVSSYSNLRDQINQRILCSDPRGFITPNEPTVQSIVSQVTGGWTNPSDWLEYRADVKLMYNWVINNIAYRSDGLYPFLPSTPSGSVAYNKEMWQLPKETLNLTQGDCEDMAALLASMELRYSGGLYKTECTCITGSLGAHVAVQIPHEGSTITLLDPAGHYYTQTMYGNIEMRDLTTEINSWLNNWKPSLGNDVYVYRVFSNTLDRSFSSTSAYITWMNSR